MLFLQGWMGDKPKIFDCFCLLEGPEGFNY